MFVQDYWESTVDMGRVRRSIDIKIILNNRSLTYIEKEIGYPIVAPDSLILRPVVNFLDAALAESESETNKKPIISNDVKKPYGKDGNMSIW